MNSVRDLDSCGFAVRVHSGGETIPIEEDGYVGRLTGKAMLELLVKPQFYGETLIDRDGIFVFSKDGKHNVQPKKNHLLSPKNGRLYRAKMTLRRNADDVSYAERPNNTIGVARITEEGKVTICYVALISQNGEFFVTVQEMYTGQCYYSTENGCSVCGFEKWPQLAELVKAACFKMKLAEILDHPPTTEEVAESVEPTPSIGMPDHFGRVLWFDASSGVGAVLTNRGVAKAYWQDIERTERRKYLATGEGVQFREIAELNSPDTEFKLEVRGIRVQGKDECQWMGDILG